MNEQKILSAVLQDRTNFDRVDQFLDSKDFTPQGLFILDEIREYYKLDDKANQVDKEILLSRLERKVPNPKHATTIKGIVNSLPDVSGANVVQEVLSLKAEGLGRSLAQKLINGESGKSVLAALEEYNAILSRQSLENPNEEVVSPTVAELVGKTLDPSRSIRLAPKALNDRLDGGARPGHHVLVFAPTEMGKTLFVINMVAAFLRQNLRVLYVGNEDPAADILTRLVCRLSGKNKFAVRDSIEEVQNEINNSGFGNLVFADLSPGTFNRIRTLVKKYKPHIVVLDQLSNIDVSTSRSESKTGNLEEAAKQARALAKGNDILVVSVVQAADSATGKVNLGRGDVHNSNVGIPGQCDLMIGIGADENMESKGLRQLTLVKNKISGNHDSFTVSFDPTISKVS